jgi:hypothetical protein
MSSSCPDGYFQDNLWATLTSSSSCQSWTSYWTAAIILIILRISLLVINLIILKRLDDDHFQKTGKNRGISLTPILETCYTITLCLCLCLASTLNATDGKSWFLFSLTFYFIDLSTLFFTAKITKMARFAESTVHPSRRLEHIRDDRILFIIFGIFHLSIVCMLIAWFLGGSLFPGSYICNKIGESAVSFYGVFVQIFCIAQLGYAYRIISNHLVVILDNDTIVAVVDSDSGGDKSTQLVTTSNSQQHHISTASTIGATGAKASVSRKKLIAVARKLKISIMGMIPLTILMSVICILLVADVLHFYWQVVLAIHYMLVLHEVIGLQNFWRQRKQQQQLTSSKKIDGGNNNQQHHHHIGGNGNQNPINNVSVRSGGGGGGGDMCCDR